jgi:hypothetical protein
MGKQIKTKAFLADKAKQKIEIAEYKFLNINLHTQTFFTFVFCILSQHTRAHLSFPRPGANPTTFEFTASG